MEQLPGSPPVRVVGATAPGGDLLGPLRRTWLDVAAETLPGDRAVLELLSRRLDELGARPQAPTEPDLLDIAENAAHHAVATGSADAARQLSKRLRRAIYEYLLTLDAVLASGGDARSSAAPVHTDPPGLPATLGRRNGGRPELIWDEPALRVLNGGVASTPPTIGAEPVSAEAAPPAPEISAPPAAEPAAWLIEQAALSDLAPEPEVADVALEFIDVALGGEHVEEAAAQPLVSAADAEAPGDEVVPVEASFARPAADAPAETPAAGLRPRFVLVDPRSFDAAAGAGEVTDAEADLEAMRVPAQFRRGGHDVPVEPVASLQPALPPLVVPSYRAWADVLASGADDEPEASSAAPFAEQRSSGRLDLGPLPTSRYVNPTAPAPMSARWPQTIALQPEDEPAGPARRDEPAEVVDGVEAGVPADPVGDATAEPVQEQRAEVDSPVADEVDKPDEPGAIAVDMDSPPSARFEPEVATEAGPAGDEAPTAVDVGPAEHRSATEVELEPADADEDAVEDTAVVEVEAALDDALVADVEAALDDALAADVDAEVAPAVAHVAPAAPVAEEALLPEPEIADGSAGEPDPEPASEPAPEQDEAPSWLPSVVTGARDEGRPAWPPVADDSADGGASPWLPAPAATAWTPDENGFGHPSTDGEDAGADLTIEAGPWPGSQRSEAYGPPLWPGSAKRPTSADANPADPGSPPSAERDASTTEGPARRDGAPATERRPAPAATEAESDSDLGAAWSIRRSPRQQALQQRMALRRREEVIRAAAAAFDDSASSRPRRDRLPELIVHRLPDQVDGLLRRKRTGEAASLVQRAAQEIGGRQIADLALQCGDRCRDRHQSRAAINSYLAAWRADPVYEAPLWRLAETCLADQETELAVGYLERIADLMRARGDDEGAIEVYHKVIAVAPERGDVRALLQTAQSLGRFPD
jgi:hypothetical protein